MLSPQKPAAPRAARPRPRASRYLRFGALFVSMATSLPSRGGGDAAPATSRRTMRSGQRTVKKKERGKNARVTEGRGGGVAVVAGREGGAAAADRAGVAPPPNCGRADRAGWRAGWRAGLTALRAGGVAARGAGAGAGPQPPSRSSQSSSSALDSFLALVPRASFKTGDGARFVIVISPDCRRLLRQRRHARQPHNNTHARRPPIPNFAYSMSKMFGGCGRRVATVNFAGAVVDRGSTGGRCCSS